MRSEGIMKNRHEKSFQGLIAQLVPNIAEEMVRRLR